jgi:hypothetical protein
MLLAAPSAALAQSTPSPAPATEPCSTSAEHRQLSFWVGEWDVTAGGKTIATSRIERIVGDCLILESYTQADGYSGKSVNVFDRTLGTWRQTWVDSVGNVSEFVGAYEDGAMRLEGETHQADGQRILRRMTLFNVGPDRVRQYSERSTDGGRTWSAAYDFIYVRRP